MEPEPGRPRLPGRSPSTARRSTSAATFDAGQRRRRPSRRRLRRRDDGHRDELEPERRPRGTVFAIAVDGSNVDRRRALRRSVGAGPRATTSRSSTRRSGAATAFAPVVGGDVWRCDCPARRVVRRRRLPERRRRAAPVARGVRPRHRPRDELGAGARPSAGPGLVPRSRCRAPRSTRSASSARCPRTVRHGIAWRVQRRARRRCWPGTRTSLGTTSTRSPSRARRVYAGGTFTSVNGGTVRDRLAAFDTSTGTATGWNPNVNGSVERAARLRLDRVRGRQLHAGERVDAAEPARGVLGVDRHRDGLEPERERPDQTRSRPRARRSTRAARSRRSTATTTRNRAAAFTLTTGAVNGWNPDFDGTRRTRSASSARRVLGGGRFTRPSNGDDSPARPGRGRTRTNGIAARLEPAPDGAVDGARRELGRARRRAARSPRSATARSAPGRASPSSRKLDRTITGTPGVSKQAIEDQRVHRRRRRRSPSPIRPPTPVDFDAAIDWGDGTPSATGTITGGNGSFTRDRHAHVHELRALTQCRRDDRRPLRAVEPQLSRRRAVDVRRRRVASTAPRFPPPTPEDRPPRRPRSAARLRPAPSAARA